jgi:hypothetical protein
MTKLWKLTLYDFSITFSVFRKIDKKDFWSYKGEYAGLECPGCKRIDQVAALSKGIQFGTVKFKKLLFESRESLTVISSSLLKVPPFNSSTLFNVYHFTDTTDYSVIIPKIIIKPDPKDGSFSHLGRPCKICKRYKNILFGSESHRMPFLKTTAMAFAYAMENQQGSNFRWYISEEIVQEIKNIRPKLYRIDLRPFEFLD